MVSLEGLRTEGPGVAGNWTKYIGVLTLGKMVYYDNIIENGPRNDVMRYQGVVSLIFPELSKIFPWNFGIAEIVFLMWISSWNFVHVPKVMLWVHVQSFSFKFSPLMSFLASYILARLFWRAHEKLVKQPPEELHEPRIFYPSGHRPETVTNAHVSTHFR